MPPKTRAERRAATQARILAAARRHFAARGYDRASVRSIAREAGIDASLVIQHFRSKERLFAQVVAERWPVAPPTTPAAPAAVVRHVLDLFLSTVNDEGGAAVEALLRSSLTHPAAAATTRRALFDGSAVPMLAPLVKGGDRELRAALVTAMLLGVHVARSLLRVGSLQKATPRQLRTHLEAAVEAMLHPRPKIR